MTYSERRNELNLTTLELRRLQNDLSFCYKIINGDVHLNVDDFLTFSNNTNLRGHSKKLVVPKTRLNCRKFSFPSRVVHPWNSLPQAVVDSASLPIFKRYIRSVDFSQFLSYHE